jgi:4-hydroxy-3-methylbut-2-enyl diphosphate reductase
VTDEDEYFPPPRELRDTMAALASIVSLAVGGAPPATSPLVDDRRTAASDVLEALVAVNGTGRL